MTDKQLILEIYVSLNVKMNKGAKTILVTGSGTGIGQAVARKFAKSGYNIIILGRRKEPLIDASNILRQIITDHIIQYMFIMYEKKFYIDIIYIIHNRWYNLLHFMSINLV